MNAGSTPVYRARTDARDWLVEAEEPLAGLQRRAGGDLPGAIVAPALLDLVRKARNHGIRLARRIEARDNGEQVSAWVEVEPGKNGAGCHIRASDWHSRPLPQDEARRDDEYRAGIARDIADFVARLGPDQVEDQATVELTDSLLSGGFVGHGRVAERHVSILF